MFDASSTPKVSCVTLPIAPTGVTLVSPVTRPATMAIRKLRKTPKMANQGLMSKSTTWQATAAASTTANQTR